MQEESGGASTVRVSGARGVVWKNRGPEASSGLPDARDQPVPYALGVLRISVKMLM